MKLILRKNDSATSLLLFIYNNYMTKCSKETIKLSSLLEILKVFGKNETAIRMSLSRAVKAGLLINNRMNGEVCYSLTPESKKAILHWNEGVARIFQRYQLRHASWDNKWYFINISFTDEFKDIKAEILDKLGQLGFAQINGNTWVTPYHQDQEVLNLVENYNLKDKIVEMHGEMKIHKKMQDFLEETYGIEKLRSAYWGFVDTYGDKLEEVRRLSKEPSFVENGSAFPILHGLGFTFFAIASDDPVLPRSILPEWEGDKAALIMRELRGLLLEATYGYLERFD